MRDVLEKLEFAAFEFVLVPADTIVFPEFKGNVFRGAVGKTLRNLTCAFKGKNCIDCLIRDKCVYSRIFESIHFEGESILKKVEKAPHPFVLYVPEKYHLEYPVNKKIHFYLVLIGEAIEYISYFILAFEEIGKRGIGKNYTPFKLDAVLCSGKSIYNPLEKKVNRDFPILSGKGFMEKRQGVQSITIEMETPVRLKFNRKLQKHITFEILTRNLLRRVQLLSALYCGGPPRVDFKGLIEESQKIKVADSKIHWVENTRFSYRQERDISMGGVSGSIEFTGNLDPFLPLLEIGEYLHVGKGTAFGLGKIRSINKKFCGGPGGGFSKEPPGRLRQ
jgi:CRISPR-associated endoribonuclease Cas6